MKMKTKALAISMLSLALCACVSKKKYTQLQNELHECQQEMGYINQRVDNYYAKINSLQDESNQKLEMIEGITALSKKNKAQIQEILKKVDPKKVANAKNMQDSLDLAMSYQLTNSLNEEGKNDIDIHVNRTVVQISISDKLLFQSGSAWVNEKAYDLLERIAKVVKSEPSMEVLVEGHTDSRRVIETSYLVDNWDLSVRRSTSIVRVLQSKFNVNGEQLIAAGRSSYHPIADNNTPNGRERNRRTNIIILPNLDKFLAMLDTEKE